MKKKNIALVGLGFGGAFVDIYRHHPAVAKLGLFDVNEALLSSFASAHDIKNTYASFGDVLKDDELDAVHLVTPIPLHEEQTIAVLESGKHCACTVPMAISLSGIKNITDTIKKSGKRYMMMETTLYTYQFLFVKQMIENGKFGKIQFMRGSHYQDMAGWPEYWMGLPPMYYGTHAIAPMAALAGSRIEKVVCFGSGTMDGALVKRYGNPFPVECALLAFENGMKGEATRSLFETARAYQEGLFVYGSDACFEWGFEDADDPYITVAHKPGAGKRGGRTTIERVQMPNFHERLPEEIKRFTVGGNYDPLNPQDSLMRGAGGGHHGSHPHLVHEFITSILDDRQPSIDERLAGNITAAGICAHDSAMNDGAVIEVPVF
jgi:predicted dehydrogenase